MYLSRMYLNPQRRGTRKLVGNPHAMHGAVQKAFPPGTTKSANGRVLWRLDHGDHDTALYIVSPVEPSFEHFQEQAGWGNQQSWAVRDYAPILDTVSVGKRFSFRLTANPTYTVTHNGKKKRCAHVTAGQQLQWLLDRASMLGSSFLVENGEPAVRITNRELLRFTRNDSRVTLARAQFDGALEVTDPEALQKVLTEGIGKGRAYGCGLLTLAPWQG